MTERTEDVVREVIRQCGGASVDPELVDLVVRCVVLDVADFYQEHKTVGESQLPALVQMAAELIMAGGPLLETLRMQQVFHHSQQMFQESDPIQERVSSRMVTPHQLATKSPLPTLEVLVDRVLAFAGEFSTFGMTEASKQRDTITKLVEHALATILDPAEWEEMEYDERKVKLLDLCNAALGATLWSVLRQAPLLHSGGEGGEDGEDEPEFSEEPRSPGRLNIDISK